MKNYYTNPLYKNYKNGDPVSQPDPYMIRENGVFYCYATGAEGVQLYTSTDFCNWEYKGICLSIKGQKEYWAPSVINIDGKFYMYFSSMPVESSDVHLQNLKVAVADTPDGDFKLIAHLLPPFSIDAHVVRTDAGEYYIFYCNNDYGAERPGTYILVDKMLSPLKTEGAPAPVCRPTVDEEIFEKDRFEKGRHWHTVEGAFYFKENGIHYLMYSGSAYTKESYFIGYSVATGSSSDLRKLRFTKYPRDNTFNPLISRNGFVEGTGHNSLIKIGEDYYVIYHGRGAGDKRSRDTRTFRADKLIIDGKKLSVKITVTPQEILL